MNGIMEEPERREEELIRRGEFKYIIDIKNDRIYCEIVPGRPETASYITVKNIDVARLRRFASKEKDGVLYFEKDILALIALPLEI